MNQIFGQSRKSFVNIGPFIGVMRIMDHVLKFMRQRIGNLVRVSRQHRRVQYKEFHRVGMRRNLGMIFIPGRKITKDSGSGFFGEKSMNPQIMINSGRKLRPEHGFFKRINFKVKFLELIIDCVGKLRKCRFFYPYDDMFSHINGFRIDLNSNFTIGINYPKKVIHSNLPIQRFRNRREFPG